jgi:hypothetical protein
MEEIRLPTSPFVLDVLPPRCGLEVQARGDSVRFRAEREGVCSEWSGWFPVVNAPIRLVWRSFWPDECE